MWARSRHWCRWWASKKRKHGAPPVPSVTACASLQWPTHQVSTRQRHRHRQVPHRCGRHSPLRALGNQLRGSGHSRLRGLPGGSRAGHAGAARLESECGCRRCADPVCAHCVRTACALHAHCMRTACTLCAHCVDPTYTYSSSSSEIRQLLGTTLGAHTRLADVRVLLLPSLAASLVSASATALPPTENHALCRALATPSVALQQRGAAEQRELPAAHPAPHPTAHPPLEHVLVVSMPGTTRWRGGPEATESLAAAAAALVQARELQGVDHTLTKAYTYCGCTYYD